MYLDTESGSMEKVDADESKETSEKAEFVIFQPDGTQDSTGECTVSGRGNSTWHMQKRPYNVNLAEEKSILGMKACRKLCLLANTFDMTNLSGENGIQMREDALEEFLRSVPKPAAVFCANDILAMQVLKACHNAKVKVPSDVAVVGCDNDELVCLNAKPQLTSIQPNFDLAGFTAAKMLDDLMRGKNVAKEPAIIGKLKLFPRNSTQNLPPSVVLVEHAMEFIKSHATDGISTSDVLKHLRVSRSLLDLRFRQLRNESVMDAILATRLNAVKYALKTTDRKIVAIGRSCGFGNPDYLKRLFKARFGISMREWRLKFRRQPR